MCCALCCGFGAGRIARAQPASAQSGSAQPAAAAPFPADLDAYIARAVRDWGVPGLAIAVVRGDTVLVAKGYGVRELGRPERVDAHTLFNIASLTKSFTAAAAAALVDAGALRWDDPVRRHLPWAEFPDPWVTREVTLRDLLAHRTGYFAANMMWVATGVDRAEALRRVRFLPRQAPFRGGMVYSNVTYALGGEVIAAAAGAPLEDVVRTRLLDPLGMRETTFRFAEVSARPNVATPHALVDGRQRPIPHRPDVAMAAAGGLYSTAADMARWLSFQLGGTAPRGRRLLSDTVLWEMHAPQQIIPVTPAFARARHVEHSAAYGLGWQVMDYRGHRMFWHSGNADGMPSYMAILPEQRLGVVVMLNTWIAPILHGVVAGRVLDAYLGVPAAEQGDGSRETLAAQRAALARDSAAWRQLEGARARDTRPSRPLQAYAGTYADSLYGEITVALPDSAARAPAKGGQLVLRLGRGKVGTLEHWQHDTFLVHWHEPMWADVFAAFVTFGLDAGGRPDALRMRLNRDDIRAGRRAAN